MRITEELIHLKQEPLVLVFCELLRALCEPTDRELDWNWFRLVHIDLI